MLRETLLKDGVHFHKASGWSFKNNKQGTRIYQIVNIYQLFLFFLISFRENLGI